MDDLYDVVVIGGGSAGTSAASASAAAGARTAMVNDGELGGLCILRGCMPTKAMLESAHALHETRHLEPFGIRLEGAAEPDFAAIMARKDRLVARFKKAKLESIERGDYEVIDARGRFLCSDSVSVDGREIRAQGFVIATGSTARIPQIPGIGDVPVWTSDHVMRLTEQPGSLIVQGAGPIGLELAQFFARIGTRVLLVNRSPLLHRQDRKAGEELRRVLETEPNLDIAVPGKIEQLRREGGGLVASVREGAKVNERNADALLVATGRDAALFDVGIENTGLDVVEGKLEHDAEMRTWNPRVWVAGDATGTHQILHLANQEGRIAGHNAAGGSPTRCMDYHLMMEVIFTDPPYARVGATEDQARQRGHDVVVAEARFPETGRAITMETRFGVWRLLADRASGQILGASILGPRADDLIHTVAVLMARETPVSAIPDLPWYHPTLSEVMIQLGRELAARIR
jgi:pyruvate/2-oxoglutarate dehydrogenase complex dihydrolipoamide dehydrogenase (E3) component